MAPREDEKIKGFVTKYLPILREKFQPSLVLAFGSRARGDALETSDLDLIVVSPRFEGIPFLDRPYRVLLELGIPGGLEFICYTEEEFQRKREELGLVRTALEQFREVNFVVTNPAGEELCFMLLINIGAPKDNDFTELYPGEAIEKSYELNRAYQLDTVGIYSVQAVYENQNDPEHGIMAWKGRLESNVVSFNVKAQ
jgi:hypothetical protein